MSFVPLRTKDFFLYQNQEEKMKKKLILSLLAIMLCTGCSSKTQKSDALGADKNEKEYKIGIVQFIDHLSLEQARLGFEDALKEEGIVAKIELQNENGDMSLTTQIPKKFQADKVDLIYALATPAAQGAVNSVKDIPIVFAAVTDPVGAGLVKTLDKPGANVTGVTDYVAAKDQVSEFLKLYPNAKRFGVIYNTSESNSDVQLQELKKNFAQMGLEIYAVGVTTTNDVGQAVASIKGKVDALFALTDNTVASAAPIVAEFLNKNKIPSISAEEGQVEKGLLMSRGISYYEHGKLAGKQAAKILKGEDPASLPVAKHTDMVKKINEKAAKALGLDLNDEFFKGAEIVK